MYIHEHAQVHRHMYIHEHLQVHRDTHEHVQVHRDTHTCTYMNIYKYIETHIHT